MILFLFEESKHMEKIKEWVMLENAVLFWSWEQQSFKGITHSKLEELGKNVLKEVKYEDERYDGAW